MTLLSLKCRSRFCAITGWGTTLFFAGLIVLLGTGWPSAQESRAAGTAAAEEVLNPRSFGPVRTDSPRRTVESFLALREEVAVALSHYNDDRNLENFEYLVDTTRQLNSLFDVSGIPETVRREMALETALVMLDIYDRIDAPPIDDIPDEFDPERVYVMPGTPFVIAHTPQQGRSGEFLFSGDVVTAAPRLLASLDRTPRHTSRDFGEWTSVFRNLTGPFFPPGIANMLPERLSVTVLDTPIWKHGLLVLVLSVPSLAIWALHRQVKHSEQRSTLRSVVARAATPLLIIGTVLFLKPVIDLHLNLFGRLDEMVDVFLTIVTYISGAWLIWLSCIFWSEILIARPSMQDETLDASLLRLAARIIGVIGAVIVLAFGLQRMGLPAFSLLAGLGVGGLAVALAIRPSLENLIGGFILYLDQPARIGDYCQLGDWYGTIERIGIRSTQIRALDRTVITIPNAQLADMQIVNWAKCDSMLIEHRLGLRYETKPDQLRWVLAKLRQMFHAHPRIESNSVRVRFSGYGESSLNIDIRVYANTREWNDFFAVTEDVLLRAGDIVAKSGTGMAFPSQTVYMTHDEGIDEKRTEMAVQRVQRWRQSGSLPFPRFAPEAIERIRNRLAYPPYGSPNYTAGDDDEEQLFDKSLEPLSVDEPVVTADDPDQDKSSRDKTN